jgi:hypothetical protein
VNGLVSVSGYLIGGQAAGNVPLLPEAEHQWWYQDHVAIVIHNYRWRPGLADGEPEYLDLEKRLAEGPVISVPTITLEGMRMARPTQTQATTPRSSQGRIRTGQSRAALDTTFRRKPRRPSPAPSGNWVRPVVAGECRGP